MSIRYITQKIAQQVRQSLMILINHDTKLMPQIDEELMSAGGAFSLDQVGH